MMSVVTLTHLNGNVNVHVDVDVDVQGTAVQNSNVVLTHVVGSLRCCPWLQERMDQHVQLRTNNHMVSAPGVFKLHCFALLKSLNHQIVYLTHTAVFVVDADRSGNTFVNELWEVLAIDNLHFRLAVCAHTIRYIIRTCCTDCLC